MWTTLASICRVSAPRRERLPPETLRLTTAGRSDCSARQLVASTLGSNRKPKTAGSSIARCAAKRCIVGNEPGAMMRSANRLKRWPRAIVAPCAEMSPAFRRSARSLHAGVHIRSATAPSGGAAIPTLAPPHRWMRASCALAPACYARISPLVQAEPANQLRIEQESRYHRRSTELRCAVRNEQSPTVCTAQLPKIIVDPAPVRKIWLSASQSSVRRLGGGPL